MLSRIQTIRPKMKFAPLYIGGKSLDDDKKRLNIRPQFLESETCINRSRTDSASKFY